MLNAPRFLEHLEEEKLCLLMLTGILIVQEPI